LLKMLFSLAEPGAARPEKPDAPLRWVTVAEAEQLTAEENLRETLRRIPLRRIPLGRIPLGRIPLGD
jgi:hypothetical protein